MCPQVLKSHWPQREVRTWIVREKDRLSRYFGVLSVFNKEKIRIFVMYKIVFLIFLNNFLCWCNSLVCPQPWAAAFWVLQLKRLKDNLQNVFCS